jgi:co-chaperonin GroES (HSP10)
MAINVIPLGNRVLVQPLEEKEIKKGGIIIPDTTKEKPQEGAGGRYAVRQRLISPRTS